MKSNIGTYFSNLNPVKVMVISGLALIFGVIFSYFAFPRILKYVMKTQLSLKPKTQMREMYTKVPFPLDFRIYLFNVSNPDEVQIGGKPRLQEVGPYYFEEWKEKYDTVDNDEDDTLEYNYKNTFIFRQELSGPGLTGQEILTLPHPMILGIGLTVNVDRKEILSLIPEVIDEMFHKPKDIFWTGPAMDMLFNGIPLDCSGESFSTAAACGEFESGEIKSIQYFNETAFKFSLFGGLNATDLGRFTVLRGSKDLKDLGRVLKFNGETEMDVWAGDECNKYIGTDTTIFPPFLEKEEGYWAFEPQMCRSMAVLYDGPSKYAGIKTNRFTLDLGDIENDESLHCYCRSPDKCPIKGTFDLFPCAGSPLIATLPHFYLTHPSLMEKIESGLHPNKEDHAVFANFYQFAGSPLQGAKRMQFNWEMVPVPEIPVLKDLPEMIFPIVWIEEAVNVNKTYTNMLKYQLILALRFKEVVKYLSIFGGIIGLIGGAVLMYLNGDKQENGTIEINVKKAESKKSGSLNGMFVDDDS